MCTTAAVAMYMIGAVLLLGSILTVAGRTDAVQGTRCPGIADGSNTRASSLGGDTADPYTPTTTFESWSTSCESSRRGRRPHAYYFS